ncbi:hypothetical protein V6K52_01495 [Knoellia sp. S7-12]|uniref:hypothetical protein n=1 Tax=Knoellia sp. S7-12 TaxID=3126698 RepID=UPI0033666BF1
MNRVDPPQEHLRWLRQADGSGWAGFDVRGWPDALWLLHGMFVDVELGQRRRLTWSELAGRAGGLAPAQMDDFPHPQQWGFDAYSDHFSEPVHEGSLDVESWDGLLGVLQDAACTECYVFICEMHTDDWAGGGEFWTGDVSELATWVGRGDDDCTPINIWAADRSWFVYTDADGLATYVGGSELLIRRLRQDDRIEIISARRSA